MPHTQAVVWVDAHEARVFQIDPHKLDKERIKADAPSRRVANRSGSVAGSDLTRDNREYFERILAELEDADGWLIVGPDATRNDLRKYLDGHAEELEKKLVGVEAMPKPTDDDLSSLARSLMTDRTRRV
jgi:stalled ribosome rescue protein Dom34